MKTTPNSIADFVCAGNNQSLRWTYNGQTIERHFANPVKSVLFRNGSGILVVEPASDKAPDTANILNSDGSMRVTIKNPETNNGAICFGDAYYVQDEITLIICFSSWQMACVIDEFGNVVRTYETR